MTDNVEIIHMSKADLERVVQNAVKTTIPETLALMGLDASDPIEVQKNMHFLTRLRSSSEKAKSASIKAIVTVLFTAAVGWLLATFGFPGV